MNKDTEKMIISLTPAITQKCTEIKETRREKRFAALFVFLSLAFIVIPTIFAIIGISLTFLILPAVFTAAALLILSPILISQQGGRTCEQI